MATRIVLAGGGSGGHVFPLLAVADSLRRMAATKGVELELYYFGPKDKYAELFDNEGITTRTVAGSKMRRYVAGLLANLLDVPRFFFGILQALIKLFWVMPEAVFSKGGPGALPVVIAATFYRIPVMIHESDATPGLTNLLSARFAARIAVSFERAAKYFRPDRTVLTGNPIRRELVKAGLTKEVAKQELGFDPAAPLILVSGGSQGSQRINDFIILVLKDLLKESQILHQTGAANFNDMKRITQVELMDVPAAQAAKTRYLPVPFIEDMGTALTAADLVVSRSGSWIFELAAFGKPSILIPLEESANDHQRADAFEYAKSGAAVVIEEPNLLPAIFMNQAKDILQKPEVAQRMGEAAKAFYKPGAADLIAGEVLRLAGIP
jgi:UDP-N-acetylglucosamine--N-acetylmuramyl-(pentapeptide) pyrophosphoryl-undecaprenol N-acetylglucosamine transferase